MSRSGDLEEAGAEEPPQVITALLLTFVSAVKCEGQRFDALAAERYGTERYGEVVAIFNGRRGEEACEAGRFGERSGLKSPECSGPQRFGPLER